MINVILLASDQPRVGKSVFSNTLLDNLSNSEKLSFAVPIKEICYNLYKDILDKFGKSPSYSLQDYKQDKKDVDINDGIFTSSPRTQYCDGSNFISTLTTDDVWGKLALHTIISKGKDYIVIDDWRRYIELDALKVNEDINILTVYLTKEDIEKYVGTVSTQAFEGQIDPDSCDIQFKFNSDWSNTDQLISLIKSQLGAA